jgi:hypothetical protein
MKKILVLLVLCGIVHAETIAVLRNEAGGVIVLTNLRENCGRYPGAVYSTSAESNRTLWGCWYSDDLMVHIDWNDGVKTSYLLEKFNINVENVRKLRERRSGGGSL